MNTNKQTDRFSPKNLHEYSIDSLLQAVFTKFGSQGTDTDDLKSKLAVLDSVMALRDSVVEGISTPSTSSYPRTFFVSAAHSSLSAPEFHAIEYDNYGPPTRWTGPLAHFSFRFFIDRSIVLRLALEFELAYFSQPLEEMQCFVDGERVDLQISGRSGGYGAFGILPNRDKMGGSVVTFVCPEMKSPRENGQDDNRILGIRFRQIKIEEKSLNMTNENHIGADDFNIVELSDLRSKDLDRQDRQHEVDKSIDPREQDFRESQD